MAPEQAEMVQFGLFLLYSEVENAPPDMPTNLFNKSGYFLFLISIPFLE